jgi:cardiolipin synthase
MTLPNFLTIIRILLVPFFVLAFFASPSNGGAWAAVGILLLSGLTDVADGYLARTRHEESILGRILDPVADKLIVLTAFTVLVLGHRIHLWLAVTLLIKELFLLSGGLYFWRRKNTVMSASWLGKGATVSLYLGILLTLLRVTGGPLVVETGVFISLLAGFDYLRKVLIRP